MAERREATAQDWIERLGLEPHPEGGWYRELHRSPLTLRRDADGQARCGITLIVYLLEGGAISRWHRVQGADEIWHHGGGAPIGLLRLPPEGGEADSCCRCGRCARRWRGDGWHVRQLHRGGSLGARSSAGGA